MHSLSGYEHIFGEVRSQFEVAVAANQHRSGSVKTEYSVFAPGIIGAQKARSLVTPLGGPERADQGWFGVCNYVQHVKLFMAAIGGYCVFHGYLAFCVVRFFLTKWGRRRFPRRASFLIPDRW